VQRRQEVECDGMRTGDGKFGVAVIEQASIGPPRIECCAEILASNPAPDQHRET